MDAIVLHSDLQPFVQQTIRPNVSLLQVSRSVLAAVNEYIYTCTLKVQRLFAFYSISD
jgi:hypothetical protein